ncbi:MAG: hypothetical protein HYZ50_20010 [Deltaproteobacteria bacterium]|nr:hypothetical protein [Deltaproteobacteria bacterium]
MQYAGSLRAHGLQASSIFDALQKANRERCEQPLDDRKVQSLAAWISKKPTGTTHNRDVEEVATHLAEIAQARDDVRKLLWRGRFGQTCFAVFMTLLDLIQKHGKTTIHVDCRTLAEQTIYTYATVAKALRALSGFSTSSKTPIPQLLHRQACRRHELLPSGKTSAYTYSLDLALVQKTHTQFWAETAVKSCLSIAPLVHDAFRSRRGLPKSCALILAVIEAGLVRSDAVLVERTRLSLRTVKTARKRLADARLIEKREGSWQRSAVALETVAKQRGSAGAAVRQNIEHARQRETYYDLLHYPSRWRKAQGIPRMRMPVGAPGPIWEGEDVLLSNMGGWYSQAEKRRLINSTESSWEEQCTVRRMDSDEYEHVGLCSKHKTSDADAYC